MLGPGMVIMEEFRQLLSQALVAFGFVTENNRAFEQGFLQLLGQIAPKIERGCAENEKIALICCGRARSCTHRHRSLNLRPLTIARGKAPEPE